jgi:deoxycytidylate deaminase
VPGDTEECQGIFGSCRDIFVHDRDADEDGVFDETGGVTTTRVSVSSAGVAGDDHSEEASISADGRLVAFESMASNLAIGGTDFQQPDIYLHDLRTGLTLLVSVSTPGVPAEFSSSLPALSPDGRLLVFDSPSGNLVPGDTNGRDDVFVDARERSSLREQLDRFLKMVFAYPYETPTRDEYGMFQAQAAALRSADLGLQVGAVIVTPDGDIVSVGTNEVPRAGGGSYWTGDSGDARDFQRGWNESLEKRKTALGELLSKLKDGGWLKSEVCVGKDMQQLTREALPLLKGTLFMSVGEFGRNSSDVMRASQFFGAQQRV